MVEVHRYQRFIVVIQDALQGAIGSITHDLVNLINRSFPRCLKGQIHHGHINGGYTDGKAVQFAVQFG